MHNILRRGLNASDLAHLSRAFSNNIFSNIILGPWVKFLGSITTQISFSAYCDGYGIFFKYCRVLCNLWPGNVCLSDIISLLSIHPFILYCVCFTLHPFFLETLFHLSHKRNVKCQTCSQIWSNVMQILS